MAEGYARASGRVGVAMATSGPGATNLVTPIADAWMDSTPLVCVTGQVRSHLIGTDAFQECDITGVTIPIVKHSWLVQDVERDPARHEGRVPRRPHGPLRPGARGRPSRHPGGRDRLPLPGPGRPARLEAAQARATRARSGRPRRAIAARREARPLRRWRHAERDACAELRELAEAARLPVDHDADGEERVLRRRTSCSSAGPACTGPSGRTGRSTRPICIDRLRLALRRSGDRASCRRSRPGRA